MKTAINLRAGKLARIQERYLRDLSTEALTASNVWRKRKMQPELFKDFLCNIQGRLFENAVLAGYDAEEFIKIFMDDELAERIDAEYDDAQWRGEGYLLEDLNARKKVPMGGGKDWLPEAMFWAGYTYRWWQLNRGTSSKEIVRIAPPKVMLGAWMGFHTLDFEQAIDELILIHDEKRKKSCLAP